MLTAIASLSVPAGTFVFRVLSRLPIAPLLGVEFVIIGVGFVFMGRAADAQHFVAAALEHVGGLLPAFMALGIANIVVAVTATAGSLRQRIGLAAGT